MVQNKHEEYRKKYISLVNARAKNWQAQRDLGYVELEKPRPNGWDVVLIPRKDIQNREDADVFWEILKVCALDGHIRVKSWYRSKHKKYINYPYVPKLTYIKKEKYDTLRPAVQKHFYFYKKGSYFDLHKIPHDFYKCTVPYFYWDSKLIRAYITSVHIIDEILLQEEDEIRKQIYYLQDKLGVGNEGKNAPKSYVKAFNRSDRRTAKHILQNYIRNGVEKEYPISGRHTANYHYW